MRIPTIKHINSNVLIGFGLICFYVVLARNADFSGQVMQPILFYGLGFSLMVLGTILRNRRKVKIPINRLFWLITLIPFIYCAANVLDFSLFVMGILLILLVRLEEDNNKTLYAIVSVVAVINAVCVFIQAIDHTFFLPLLRNILAPGMYEYYIKILGKSYLSGCNAIVGDTAGFLLNGIGIFICCIIARDAKKMKLSAYILMAILAGALLFTGKRSQLLCGLVVTILLYILSGKSTKKFKRIAASLLVLGAAYLLIDILVSIFPSAYTISRMLDSINGLLLGEDVSSGRSTLYRYAIEQFQSAPIFGIGWKEFNQLSTSLYNYSSTHYVNNDYLQILCETGLVGFICIFAPMFAFLHKSLKAFAVINNAPGLYAPETRMAILYSLFIQLYYLMYLFLENPLYNRSFFFMYILSVLIGYSAIRKC